MVSDAAVVDDGAVHPPFPGPGAAVLPEPRDRPAQALRQGYSRLPARARSQAARVALEALHVEPPQAPRVRPDLEALVPEERRDLAHQLPDADCPVRAHV